MTTWLVCINPNIYDYKTAYEKTGGILEYYHWGNYEIGETVYLYIPCTDKAIRYKSVVIANNLKYEETADYWLYLYKKRCPSEKRYCRFKVVEEIDDKRLSIKALKNLGITNLSGVKKLSGELLTHIESIFDGNTKNMNVLLKRWKQFSRSVEVVSESFQGISVLPNDEKRKIEVDLFDDKIAEIDMKLGDYCIRANWLLSKIGQSDNIATGVVTKIYPLEDISAIDQLFQYMEEKSETLIMEKCSEDLENIDGFMLESGLTGRDKEVIAKERINQSYFRNGLIMRYKSCCMCGISDSNLLIASHIKPWAVSTAEEKTDFDNGLLLCPNHDKECLTNMI